MPKRKRRGLPDAADLDLAEDLVRPMLEHGFRVVDAELVRGDQLHRALFFRNGCRRHKNGFRCHTRCFDNCMIDAIRRWA